MEKCIGQLNSLYLGLIANTFLNTQQHIFLSLGVVISYAFVNWPFARSPIIFNVIYDLFRFQDWVETFVSDCHWPNFCVSSCHGAPPVFPKAPLSLYLLSSIWLPGILWCENRILIVSSCLWDRTASWIRANFGVQSIKCQILKTARLRSLCTDEKVIRGPGIEKGKKRK